VAFAERRQLALFFGWDRVVRRSLRLIVSALLLAVIAWRTSWGEIVEQFTNLRVEWWLAAVGLQMLAQVASARRWQRFAQELRFRHPLAQYCAYSFIGMFFSLVLPTSVGGDVMRVWYLEGQSGRRWAAVASVFLDRFNGVMILVATACVGVLVSPLALPGWMIASVWGVASCAVLGLVCLPILQRWRRLPVERREQLLIVARLLRSPWLLLETSALSILVQVAGVASVCFLGVGLGLEIPVAFYGVMVPMVTLLTLLPISVNGMGVREGGLALFLLPLGIDVSTALALALLWFSVGVAVGLAGGVIYLHDIFVSERNGAPAPTEESAESPHPKPFSQSL
jgi:uncharacterized membrane protein YbhN (UPF0104 family)